MYQKRYLYLKDSVLYYAHREFSPDISARHCKIIQLTADIKYSAPSEVADYRAHMNKSIDLVVDGKTITFVSDAEFPNSANFILTVCVSNVLNYS